MKHLILLAAAAFPVAAPALAQRSRPAPAPVPARQIADDVSGQSLRAMVERLVSFGTRHTLSSQTDPRRGIGASLRWTEAEFRRYSRACGNCLQIATPSDTVTGRRVPTPTLIKNVFAIQRGTSEPNRVVIISGHIDSRVTDVLDATKDAPGANDDGSGTAATIEAARVLSRYKFPTTIVYAVLSGEEQGLLGGKIMADYAKAQGWEVIANLNNDIIGNSCGSDGKCDADHVRVFSEGPRWQGREDLAARQRSLGGENDSPSRNLSRWLDDLADDLSLGLDVRQIWRNDRFGRGGDHTEMLNAGYPAIRFSVAVENYNHQHQDLRVENGIEYGDTIDKMDFAYLTKVVKLNVAALAALARTAGVPEPTVEGAVSTDTTLKWQPVRGAQAYVVRWRPTDATNWEDSVRLTDPCVILPTDPPVDGGCGHVLKGVRVDDSVFGVSSVSADGHESPVASAVPGGAFRPYTPPPPPPAQ
ncbi:MAG TPA: M28 family peptidase [Allosphingosinicella sp.]|uniref:M28 family peptidase n=1 Tax=Allosphingosinicella sp. TaxID=2823234 RepID=UPI002F2992A0